MPATKYPPRKKKPRLIDLVPQDDLPPARQVQRFVEFYVNSRDLAEAACLAGLDPKMGAILYREDKVRKSIDHKIALIDGEKAKLKATADLLTIDLIDTALYEEVKSKKNGHIRVRAMELAYKRKGMIRDGEFYVAPDPNMGNNSPYIYQAGQTTLRRTVTEEVTQTLPASTPDEDEMTIFIPRRLSSR